MKPAALWSFAALAGLALWAGLSWRPAFASSPGMPTLAKSRKPARKATAKGKTAGRSRIVPIPADWDVGPPIAPPPSKFSAADLLADVESGEYGRGVDFAAVKRAVASRSTRRAA